MDRLDVVVVSDFFFPDKRDFAADVGVEVERHHPGWVAALVNGTDSLDIVRSLHPYLSHWALRPFVEAYQVVADTLERRDYRSEIDRKQFLAECMVLGRQYHLQRRIQSAASVSQVLIRTALRLADNRGLLEPGTPDLAERRRAFAEEVRAYVRRVDAIDALAASRRAGLID